MYKKISCSQYLNKIGLDIKPGCQICAATNMINLPIEFQIIKVNHKTNKENCFIQLDQEPHLTCRFRVQTQH